MPSSVRLFYSMKNPCSGTICPFSTTKQGKVKPCRLISGIKSAQVATIYKIYSTDPHSLEVIISLIAEFGSHLSHSITETRTNKYIQKHRLGVPLFLSESLNFLPQFSALTINSSATCHETSMTYVVCVQ